MTLIVIKYKLLLFQSATSLKRRQDWRQGSAMESTYSYRGPGFVPFTCIAAHNTHNSSSKGSKPASHLFGHQAHIWYTDRHLSKTHIHIR